MTQQQAAPTQPPTEEDILGLSQRLQELDKTLPAGQRLALRSLMLKATGKQNDVQGFYYYDCVWDYYGDWYCAWWY